MADIYVYAYVEDEPTEAVLKKMIEYVNSYSRNRFLFCNGAPVITRGYGNLKNTACRFLRAEKSGIWSIFVTDLDQFETVHSLCNNWFGLSCFRQLPSQMIFRIAVREVESWIIADKESCITVESMSDGLHIYDNPVGVLTNNPPFNIQMFNLNNYMGLSARQPESNFSDKLEFNRYSRGMGALGLPGDLSSQSRFVKVAFTKMNSVSGDDEKASVSQFFHILGSVDQLDNDKYEITIYTCCCNTTKGLYYYTSYDNHQICAVDMHKENLDDDKLVRYPLITDGEIRAVN